MRNFVTTLGARLVGIWVAALASWLLAKYGVTMDSATQQALVEHFVALIIPVFMTIYAVVHRVTSKATNPGDAASGTLANAESVQTAQLKRQG